jgi:predicted nucleic acid-binding protein
MAAEPSCLMDTGPLVAALNARDRWHAWATTMLKQLPQPFATCEAVFSEAAFLLRGTARRSLSALLDEGHGQLVALNDDIERIAALLNKYEDTPMDVADGCLVRLSERFPKLPIVTLDSDFLVYRRRRSERIPLIAPFA